MIARRLERAASRAATRPATLLGRLRRASAAPGRPTSSGSTAGGSSARPAPSWPRPRSGIFRPRCASSTIPSSSRPTRRLTACACRMRSAALELAAGDAAGSRLLARTLPKWADLRRDLAGFVRKHDHRNREPFTEAEASAYLRAIEALHGQAGLFANDLRGQGAVRAPRVPAAGIGVESARRPSERSTDPARVYGAGRTRRSDRIRAPVSDLRARRPLARRYSSPTGR